MPADPAAAVDREEAELVRAASGGDEPAVAEVLRRHASLVLALGVRLLGNRADAEDLLQDVFIRIHRGLSSFRGDSSLKTWICQVTINAARNRKRSDRRRLLHLTDSLDAPVHDDPDGYSPADRIADDRATPDRLALSAEVRRRVETAIAGLPAEFREALVLRELEGMAYEDIATALDVSTGTVKSRIARGRARLQEALADLVATRSRAGSAS